MDEELFCTWMSKTGEIAARKLWQMANDHDATPQQRERLLQWFAEMALGKPRTMEAAVARSVEGTGVIILPAATELDTQ